MLIIFAWRNNFFLHRKIQNDYEQISSSLRMFKLEINVPTQVLLRHVSISEPQRALASQNWSTTSNFADPVLMTRMRESTSWPKINAYLPRNWMTRLKMEKIRRKILCWLTWGWIRSLRLGLFQVGYLSYYIKTLDHNE